MLKISIVESPKQRRLIVEGKLLSPWAGELKDACEKARADLQGRELIVVLDHLVTINPEGEKLLLDLMKNGVKIRSRGVFTKHILKLIAKRAREEEVQKEKQ